jgi:hypothetical protein
VEVPHPREFVVVRRQPLRVPRRRPSGAGGGAQASGPNSSKANVRSGCSATTCSMRASLVSRCGSGDSFQVLVRWKVISWAASSCRARSRPIRTIRTGLSARWSTSLRRLQWVNGRPSFSGRVVAVATRKASSSALIRRGRPPAQRGFSALIPSSLNRWITSRTVSHSGPLRDNPVPQAFRVEPFRRITARAAGGGPRMSAAVRFRRSRANAVVSEPLRTTADAVGWPPSWHHLGAA